MVAMRGTKGRGGSWSVGDECPAVAVARDREGRCDIVAHQRNVSGMAAIRNRQCAPRARPGKAWSSDRRKINVAKIQRITARHAGYSSSKARGVIKLQRSSR